MDALLRSSLLIRNGFRHAFTLRPEEKETDGPESLEALRQRAARAVECAPERLYEVTQVHSAVVEKVDGERKSEALLPRQADALVSSAPNTAVGVRVADCLPLLVGDPVTGAAAAIHAGWRGVEAGVVRAAVEALLSVPGVRAPNLLAAIFPHIRPCCFEVGQEVADRLQAPYRDVSVLSRPERDKPPVDLAAIVRTQLASSGVAADRVDDVAGCTRCDPERFYSYRRLGQLAGRHLAAIAVRC
mgnify:CR=1 FL=1